MSAVGYQCFSRAARPLLWSNAGVSEPSERWLSRRREAGSLPFARGVVAAGALAGIAVASPLVLGSVEAAEALARGALVGRATLGDAAWTLAALALPLLAGGAVGALVGGALHARYLGRGGAGALPAPVALLGFVAAALGAFALVVSAARASLDGGGSGALAASLAVRVVVLAGATSVALAAGALSRARALRDEFHARDPERDPPREAARRRR